MITLLLTVSAIVGFIVLIRKAPSIAPNSYEAREGLTALFAVCTGLMTVLLIIQVFCGVDNYVDSLELPKLQQDAITARQAVLKNRNYSNKEFTARGALLKGSELNVRYGEPLIRQNLEKSAVMTIRYYNKELARMKGAKRGWLWTPGWGYSSHVDSMRPIDVPQMR